MIIHPPKPYQLNVSWVDDPSAKLRASRIDSTRAFREPWEFVLTIAWIRYSITVPAGWLTDGPSIPGAFAWVIPRNDQTGPAGYIHDVIYAKRGKLPITGCDDMLRVSRYQADSVFHLACLKMELSRWRADLASKALFFFGWAAWSAESKTDRANKNLTITVNRLD